MDLYFFILLILSLAILLIICTLNSETGIEKYLKRKSEFESLASSKRNNKDLKQCPFEIKLDDLLVNHVIGVNYACISVRFRCVLITHLHDSHSYSLTLR